MNPDTSLKHRTLTSDILLLITSAIWGFAFVAQRAGMAYIGPFLFNGIRFLLGSLALLGVLFGMFRVTQKGQSFRAYLLQREHVTAGFLAGIALTLGASFQQMGIVSTTAGKAGFITGLYVILVPILGIFLGKRSYPEAWVGAVFAVIGLYFLTIGHRFSIAMGDLLVLISAVFWAAHVHIIDHYTSRMDSLPLAFFQFFFCGWVSLGLAIVLEPVEVPAIRAAWIPIAYAGLLSTAVAYTLQVVAQKQAHHTHAAILLSLEAVFAVIGGMWLLNETLTLRQWLGIALMFSGMLLSQFRWFSRRRTSVR